MEAVAKFLARKRSVMSQAAPTAQITAPQTTLTPRALAPAPRTATAAATPRVTVETAATLAQGVIKMPR